MVAITFVTGLLACAEDSILQRAAEAEKARTEAAGGAGAPGAPPPGSPQPGVPTEPQPGVPGSSPPGAPQPGGPQPSGPQNPDGTGIPEQPKPGVPQEPTPAPPGSPLVVQPGQAAGVPGAPAPGIPTPPKPGIPTQPPPGGGGMRYDGPTITVTGMVSFPAWKRGKVKVVAFDGDHSVRGAKPPSVVGEATLERPGAYTLTLPASKGRVWIEGTVDADENGRPGPLDPSGMAERTPVTLGTTSITSLDITITEREPPGDGGIDRF